MITVENVTGLPILNIDGGDNVDTISFADYAATAWTDAIGINLAVVRPTANSFTQIGSGVVHTVTNVENVVGSDSDDIIGGSALNNVLSGGAGDDILYGGMGEDVLNGGMGADQFLFNAL